MNVFQKARELADALTESQAFLAYQEAEIEALNDEQLESLMASLRDAEQRLQRCTDRDEARVVADQVRLVAETIQRHPVYARLQERRQQFDQFVARVLDEISLRISGTPRSELPCGRMSTSGQPATGRAFELARELAEALLATPEYLSYEEAERRFLADGNVPHVIAALRADEERLRSFQYATPEEGHALRIRIDERRRELASRASYQRYIAAREAFDRLVGTVLDAITFEISGSQREGTGCGTAGGACGCGSGLNLPAARRMERALADIRPSA